jgi:hypothetical protein
MKQLFLVSAVSLLCHAAFAQEGEIVEARRRLAIISAGSEQGIKKSDTLWVTDISEKKDHLVAKASVIALRKRYAAIEAFQYFGAFRLAVGQRVFRVKDHPAPLTAPPKIIRRHAQKPELTLADVHRQLLRVYVFAGGVQPFGDLAEAFGASLNGGLGVRVNLLPRVHMSLSGRYIFLRNTDDAQKRLKAAGRESASWQVALAAAVRPLSRAFIVEVGPALYATRTTITGAGVDSKSTFFDGGAVAGFGKYFTLNDRLSWVLLTSLHGYVTDGGFRSFVTVDAQIHF